MSSMTRTCWTCEISPGRIPGFDMDAYIVQFSKIEESEDARGFRSWMSLSAPSPNKSWNRMLASVKSCRWEPYVLDTKTNVLEACSSRA